MKKYLLFILFFTLMMLGCCHAKEEEKTITALMSTEDQCNGIKCKELGKCEDRDAEGNKLKWMQFSFK